MLVFTVGSGTATLARSLPENEESARTMRLAKFVVPEFPEFLRRTGVLDGTVAVAIGHDSVGKPDDVLVLESTDARFTRAALEAIAGWRFESATRQPRPREAVVPVVRFLFTSGNVSVVPLRLGASGIAGRKIRANTPVELPSFGQLDARPKPLRQPMPRISGGAPGSAIIKFFVDEDGRARVPIAIDATSEALAEAAVQAVRQWRFEPPRIDGKPVVALESWVFRTGATRP